MHKKVSATIAPPLPADLPTDTKTPTVMVEASHCPKCKSTKREKYHRTTRQEYSGLDPSGRPYVAILRHWTRCAEEGCGQGRIDRSYEYGPEKI